MPVGVVKWFNPQQSFCFIQPEGEAGSVFDFVPVSAVERPGKAPVRKGQKVSYDVEQDRGEPPAGYPGIVE